ncbi:hypothetical protein Pelo_788 [Pelomyxa schiedti]|nr:hypothetical protein Pelo_788 [Pelomyxa schiedti]
MWWAERGAEGILCSSRDYLVKHRYQVSGFLQDRVTGQRIQLLDEAYFDRSSTTFATTGKWLVFWDQTAREMIVVEIPKKNSAGPTAFKAPTVVSMGATVSRKLTHCLPQFSSFDEDLLLLLFFSPYNLCEIILVDLVRTCSSKTLAVLSSTVPRLEDLHIPNYQDLVRLYFVVTQESGARAFITEGYVSDASEIIAIEEGTGKLKRPCQTLGARAPLSWCRSQQLNKSQFCAFGSESEYEVWDVDDSTKPVRTQKFRGAFPKLGFVEGGLLFQPGEGESTKEIQVTEECTGAHIVTFRLFRPLEKSKQKTRSVGLRLRHDFRRQEEIRTEHNTQTTKTKLNTHQPTMSLSSLSSISTPSTATLPAPPAAAVTTTTITTTTTLQPHDAAACDADADTGSDSGRDSPLSPIPASTPTPTPTTGTTPNAARRPAPHHPGQHPATPAAPDPPGQMGAGVPASPSPSHTHSPSQSLAQSLSVSPSSSTTLSIMMGGGGAAAAAHGGGGGGNGHGHGHGHASELGKELSVPPVTATPPTPPAPPTPSPSLSPLFPQPQYVAHVHKLRSKTPTRVGAARIVLAALAKLFALERERSAPAPPKPNNRIDGIVEEPSPSPLSVHTHLRSTQKSASSQELSSSHKNSRSSRSAASSHSHRTHSHSPSPKSEQLLDGSAAPPLPSTAVPPATNSTFCTPHSHSHTHHHITLKPLNNTVNTTPETLPPPSSPFPTDKTPSPVVLEPLSPEVFCTIEQWEKRLLKKVKHHLKKNTEDTIISEKEHSELIDEFVSSLGSLCPKSKSSEVVSEAQSTDIQEPSPTGISPPPKCDSDKNIASRLACEILIKFLKYLTESLFPSYMFHALSSLPNSNHNREEIGALRIMINSLSTCNSKLVTELPSFLASFPTGHPLAYCLWSSFESVLIWAPESRIGSAEEMKRVRNLKLDEWLCTTLVSNIDKIQSEKPSKLHCKPEKGILKASLLSECIGVGSETIPKNSIVIAHDIDCQNHTYLIGGQDIPHLWIDCTNIGLLFPDGPVYIYSPSPSPSPPTSPSPTRRGFQPNSGNDMGGSVSGSTYGSCSSSNSSGSFGGSSSGGSIGSIGGSSSSSGVVSAELLLGSKKAPTLIPPPNGNTVSSATALLSPAKPNNSHFPTLPVLPPTQFSHRAGTRHGSLRAPPPSSIPPPAAFPPPPSFPTASPHIATPPSLDSTTARVQAVPGTPALTPPPTRSALTLLMAQSINPPKPDESHSESPSPALPGPPPVQAILSATMLKTPTAPPPSTSSDSTQYADATSLVPVPLKCVATNSLPTASSTVRPCRQSVSATSLLTIGPPAANFPPPPLPLPVQDQPPQRINHLKPSPSPPPHSRGSSSPSPRSRSISPPPPPLPPMPNVPWVKQLPATQQAQLPLMLSMRKKAVDELCATETIYLEKLNIIVSLVYHPLCRDREISLSGAEMLSIFCNITLLRDYHKRFKKALEHRLKVWNESCTLGDIFLQAKWLIFYKHFANNFDGMRNTIAMCKQKLSTFSDFLKELEFRDILQYQNVEGMMISLIQRMPRYILLIEELIKNTPSTHPDRLLLEGALQHLRQAAEYTNTQQRTPTTQAQLQNLEDTIHGLPIQLTGPPSEADRKGDDETSIRQSGWRGIGGVPRAVLHNGELNVGGKRSNVWLLTDLLIVTGSAVRNGKLNLHHIFSLASISFPGFDSPSTAPAFGACPVSSGPAALSLGVGASLGGLGIASATPPPAKKSKTFTLNTMSGLLMFKTNSAEECDVWVQKIQNALQKVKAAMKSSPKVCIDPSDMANRVAVLACLHTSEAKYLKNLEFIFQVRTHVKCQLTRARKKKVLCNFCHIIKEHQMFLEHIDQSIQSWDDDLYIDLLPSIPSRFKKVYKVYFKFRFGGFLEILHSPAYLEYINAPDNEPPNATPDICTLKPDTRGRRRTHSTDHSQSLEPPTFPATQETVLSWLDKPLKRLQEYYLMSQDVFDHSYSKSKDYEPLHDMLVTMHSFLTKTASHCPDGTITPIPPPSPMVQAEQSNSPDNKVSPPPPTPLTLSAKAILNSKISPPPSSVPPPLTIPPPPSLASDIISPATKRRFTASPPCTPPVPPPSESNNQSPSPPLTTALSVPSCTVAIARGISPKTHSLIPPPNSIPPPPSAIPTPPTPTTTTTTTTTTSTILLLSPTTGARTSPSTSPSCITPASAIPPPPPSCNPSHIPPPPSTVVRIPIPPPPGLPTPIPSPHHSSSSSSSKQGGGGGGGGSTTDPPPPFRESTLIPPPPTPGTSISSGGGGGGAVLSAAALLLGPTPNHHSPSKST